MLFGCLIALGLTGPATAVSLAVNPDKLTYSIGETITLSITGDDTGGGTSYAVYGRLLYNGALVNNDTRKQILIQGEKSKWVGGSLENGDTNANSATSAFSEAFDQVTLSAQTATNLPGALSTVTLIAQSAGVVNAIWDVTNPGFQLYFFGLANAPGASFTIVPEPTSLALLALGLLGLARVPRRVS
jgi:hypothetical protein